MCCRVFPIPEANKPHTDWCANLVHGEGCRIYASRPQPCRDFLCGWRNDENLGEEWRPDIAGFVLSDPAPWALLVTNDPDRPLSWRREPYYAAILYWAREASRQGLFASVRESKKLLLLDGVNEVAINDE